MLKQDLMWLQQLRVIQQVDRLWLKLLIQHVNRLWLIQHVNRLWLKLLWQHVNRLWRRRRLMWGNGGEIKIGRKGGSGRGTGMGTDPLDGRLLLNDQILLLALSVLWQSRGR
jgi:hypothetical protein